MLKPAKIAIAVVLVVLVGLITWQLMAVREPVYQRKPLSVWLEQYGTNHWSAGSGGELDKEAQAAIKQIGTNAIPQYLRMMSAREWPLKAKLLAVIHSSSIITKKMNRLLFWIGASLTFCFF